MEKKGSAPLVNWISFILFFVLTFFLIGEQLPALPTYLLGQGLGSDAPDKLHIILERLNNNEPKRILF